MSGLNVISTDIHQRYGLYSLNNLHVAAITSGHVRHARTKEPAKFMASPHTVDLIEEIKTTQNPGDLTAKTLPGRNGGTYVCKELVYAYAMWISPKFHLTVIRAFDAMQSNEPTPSMLNKRWLVTLDDQGREHVRLIPYGAVVMTPVDFLKAIANGTTGHSVTDGDLLEFIQAASARLKTRADVRHYNESRVVR